MQRLWTRKIMTFGLGQLSVLLATALAAAEKAWERVEPRLDPQVETLCMVWKQRGAVVLPHRYSALSSP